MREGLTEDEMIALGWHTYYNPKYWVHTDTVSDPTRQDYTDYGFTFEDAVRYEALGRPKFRPMGMPMVSKMAMARATKGLSQLPESAR